MKRFQMVVGLGVLCLWMVGCASPVANNTLYQTSTIDALLAGVYDGDKTLEEVAAHGDLGLGTFQHLDGEMIFLDGDFYQVKVDGRVYRPDLKGKTPFAAVCDFTPEKAFAVIEGTDMTGLEAIIDRQSPNLNQFCAIRMEGHFKTMKTRSVPAQKKPYPPLKEVAKKQAVFHMENVAGTIIGFRSPPFVKGVGVPGYHLHFISQDRSRGGHILAFEVVTGTAQVDVLNRFVMELPDTEAFATVDLSPDRQTDLKSVEKDKAMR